MRTSTWTRPVIGLVVLSLIGLTGCEDDAPQSRRAKPAGHGGEPSVPVQPMFDKTGVHLLDALNKPRGFRLVLRTGEGQSQYVEGEGVSFEATVNRQCYVTLLLVDSAGEMRLLYPNRWETTGLLNPGKTATVPPAKLHFKFPISSPHGELRVRAIATATPLTLVGIDETRILDEGLVDLGNVNDIADAPSKRLTSGDLADLFRSDYWVTADLKITTRAVPDITSDANEKLLALWNKLDTGGTKSIGQPARITRPLRRPKDEPAPVGLIVYYNDQETVTKAIGAAGGRPLGPPGSLLATARVVDLIEPGTKTLDAKAALDQRIRQLESDPSVKAVVPNYRRYLFSSVPKTRLQPVQWALHNPHNPKFDIGWQKAADRIASIKPVTVGVVDQGLVTTDARLKALAWTNTKEKPGNGVDDDYNGYVDDVHGFNIVDDSGVLFDPKVTDNHGSFVSSIIAGRSTGGSDDVIGIAPGAQIITGVAINEEGYATDADILRAVAYVVQAGAKVVNLSLGGYTTQEQLEKYVNAHSWFLDALERKGIILVCAAGNEFTDNDWLPSVPANIPKPNIISVCAIDADGALARYQDYQGLWRPYSNYGKKTVHIGAPGSLMLGIPTKGQQALNNGTSFAAPVVTATLALVWGQNPTWDYRTVIRAVMETASPSPYLKDRCKTGGVVNIDAALRWRP